MLLIVKVIQFVIIYLIMVYKFQKFGRMSNIKTLKEICIEKHKHLMMQHMEKYQINNIIMILTYKTKMDIL